MILLVGYWDGDANLVIESSQEVPDSTPKAQLEAEVYRGMAEEHRQNGWAVCSWSTTTIAPARRRTRRTSKRSAKTAPG
ncbi:hypothetical protein [Streptomyces sp. Midd1]|uniref:hypothetical protein n=1 Tax=Streptomyces sp. Midd3 TaxID=3161191 RepID=UPI0034DAC804